MMGLAVVVITAIIYTLFPLYMGGYYRQEQNAYRLTIRVLDLDSQYSAVIPGAPAAALGPAVRQAVQQNIQASPHYHLGWQIADPSELSLLKLTTRGPYSQGRNASEYAEHLVLNQDVFGVILVNPNATLLATQAAQRGGTVDPRGSISFFYEEGRNSVTANQRVVFFSTQLIESAIAEGARQFTGSLLANALSNATALTASLDAMTIPFGYSAHNLRPFDQPGAQAPLNAAAIYLIIFCFFFTPVWKSSYEVLRPRLKATSDILLRLVVPVVGYFWISASGSQASSCFLTGSQLCYSLVTLAYHVDFTRKYGHIGFFLYWMLNFVTMIALGYVMDSVLSLMGLLYFPFFLLFWVVLNVSIAFRDLSDMDRFYLYGFSLPVWNSLDGAKSIILGTKNHLLQNFAVNLGWVFGAGFALLAISVWQRATNRDQFSNKSAKFAQLKSGQMRLDERRIRQEERDRLLNEKGGPNATGVVLS